MRSESELRSIAKEIKKMVSNGEGFITGLETMTEMADLTSEEIKEVKSLYPRVTSD